MLDWGLDFLSGLANLARDPAGTITGWTFDKVTNVHYAGTAHDEDQPSHLVVLDTDICRTRCTEEYGNPCVQFCPAHVYEWELDDLKREPEWASGQNARTLVKHDTLRIVLTALKAGHRIPEHQTDSPISIQTLSGRIHVRAGDRTFDLISHRHEPMLSVIEGGV